MFRRVFTARLALSCAALVGGQSALAASVDVGEPARAVEIALRLADAPRWTDVLAREARDAGPAPKASVRCMMPADDLPAECAARGWRAAFQTLRGLSEDDRITGVQARVNKLPYVSDMANWGMADRWETPEEMFARGGDCEDYALTKYFALRELGISETAMRLAIVWDAVDGEQHAVLYVDAVGSRWVLDNKFAAPVPAESVAGRYREIWSVNRDGARLSATGFGADDAGPRLRIARGGKMLVLRTRPVRRAVAMPMPRIEVAAEGPGRPRRVSMAQLGRGIAPVALVRLAGALPPKSPVPARETALRIDLAHAGEALVLPAGK